MSARLSWGLSAAVLAAGLVGAPAFAQSMRPAAAVKAVQDCLAKQDVACAEQAAEAGGLEDIASPEVRGLMADLAHHQGDYRTANERIQEAVALGYGDPYDWAGLYERTLFATAGWVEVNKGRFRIRFRPGVDAVLLREAAEVLQATDARVTPLIGAPPPGNTIVELYPDGRSFVAASGLTYDDILATGVVAISKWTKLLVTSPRARASGYAWRSTLSHEYLHLVISHATDDKAPVWLQEAIAKCLDHRFEEDAFSLSARQSGLLYDALQADDFVPFSEMTVSLAKIKVVDENGELDVQASADRASLAYAQLASLMDYSMQQGGEDLLTRVLPRVRDGEDPGAVLADEAGEASYATLSAAWKRWLATQPLSSADVGAVPTILDGGTEAELDPVLNRRQDLANHLRLGDLLRARDRLDAALVEYDKAVDPEEPASPLWASKVALTQVQRGDLPAADAVLAPALKAYPEVSRVQKTAGAVALAAGRKKEAAEAWQRALHLDPFDVALRQQQIELWEALGAEAELRQGRADLDLFARGGSSANGRVLHNVVGQFELPRAEGSGSADGQPAVKRSRLKGKPAPDVRWTPMGATDAPVSLSSLRGKVVVLDFWATWCGPCVAVMPRLSDLASRRAADGLVVVGVSNEDEATVQRFLAKQSAKGVTYTHRLALEDGSARTAFGVRALPTLAVIDRQGIVRLVHVGSGGMAEVEAAIDAALSATAGPTPDNAVPDTPSPL